jgi:serine/threonine protein kinase
MVKKGSKGCVIPQTTEYKCSDNLELDKPYITKIESSSDGINEIENYKLIDEIIGDVNKDNRFFIGHPIVCNTDSNIKKELYSEKCNGDSKDGTDIKFIDYINGGSSLADIFDLDITRDSDFYINLFKGLLNVFEAVKILNERKVYHFDIKPQNIVYDNSVMPPLLKLIDLGDSKYIPSPIDYKKEYNQIGTTGYFPPEKFGERGDSVFLLFVSGRGKEDSEILDYIRVNDEWLLNLTGETMSKAEYNKLKQENPEWYTKTDVWSLGATIFYILKQLEEDIDTDKYHNKNEFNYRTLFSKINMECIHALMRKMLMLDIENRPDAGEAFQLYKDCLPKSQGGATKKRRVTKKRRLTKKKKTNPTKKRRRHY